VRLVLGPDRRFPEWNAEDLALDLFLNRVDATRRQGLMGLDFAAAFERCARPVLRKRHARGGPCAIIALRCRFEAIQLMAASTAAVASRTSL
jgi:hypothetical protein